MNCIDAVSGSAHRGQSMRHGLALSGSLVGRVHSCFSMQPAFRSSDSTPAAGGEDPTVAPIVDGEDPVGVDEAHAEDSSFDDPMVADDVGPTAIGRNLPRSVSDDQIRAWVDAIVDSDEQALAALYDATLSRVYGLVLRVVRRPALAEEVVEDTYFQVWRQAVRFDPERGNAIAWLLGMARSRAIDALRREARFNHPSLDDDEVADVVGPGLPADELLDAARGHAELHRALLLLNAQPRQLVALAFFRGLSHEAIASQTCLPLGTVKSQIRRALITLRQALGDGGLPARMA